MTRVYTCRGYSGESSKGCSISRTGDLIELRNSHANSTTSTPALYLSCTPVCRFTILYFFASSHFFVRLFYR